MAFFRRNKNKNNDDESSQFEKSRSEQAVADPSADSKPALGGSLETSPQRVGVVSGVLSTSAESDGLSQFGAIVERRFGPGPGAGSSADGESLPPRHVAADSSLNPRRDAFDEHEHLQSIEADRIDELDSPKLEVDPMGLIGHATTITGEIVADEDLEIQGRIEGSVRLVGHRVTVGSDGIVNATVEALSVLVIGKITGDVIATESVEVKAGGFIGGDVKAPRVIMHDGAIVIGGLDMSTAQPISEAPSASESPTPERPRLMRVELSDDPVSKKDSV